MAKPTIIKEFPGQAVEEWRKRHYGFLPTEEKDWLESLITAIKASGWPKIHEVELDELRALALAGIDSRVPYVQGEDSKDAERWRFCLEHEFPHHAWNAKGNFRYWYVPKFDDFPECLKHDTPVKAIDAAIARARISLGEDSHG